MMSSPVYKNALLSRQLSVANKKLIRKFQDMLRKTARTAPVKGNTIMSFSVCKKNSLCHGKHASQIKGYYVAQLESQGNAFLIC